MTGRTLTLAMYVLAILFLISLGLDCASCYYRYRAYFSSTTVTSPNTVGLIIFFGGIIGFSILAYFLIRFLIVKEPEGNNNTTTKKFIMQYIKDWHNKSICRTIEFTK